MATEPEPAVEPPECSNCEIEMEFMASGTQASAPVVGTEIDY